MSTPGTYAIFTTSEGTIKTKLFPEVAPKTVENFISLAEGTKDWIHPTGGPKKGEKLYDGTIFHRVIPQFMIQGGDPAGNGMGGPGYDLKTRPRARRTSSTSPANSPWPTPAPTPTAPSSSSPW